MNTKEQVLQNCTVEVGNIIKLPSVQLERKVYLDVAKSLELIGGKWNRKVSGFQFSIDPTELLEQIANGEKRNLKKEFQFFATPDTIADRLVNLADINDPFLMVLEPSAGQGAIVKALLRKEPDLIIHAYELMEINRNILSKIEDCIILGDDFLKRITYREPSFDRIVANPPFSNNQDIDHIYQMYNSLKNGGKLVSVASKHWEFSSNKKEINFRNWLSEVNASIYQIEAGAFKESGTMISACIIVINK